MDIEVGMKEPHDAITAKNVWDRMDAFVRVSERFEDEWRKKISKLDDRLKVLEAKEITCTCPNHKETHGERITIDRKVAEEWLVHFRDFNHQGWHADLKNEIRRELGR